MDGNRTDRRYHENRSSDVVGAPYARSRRSTACILVAERYAVLRHRHATNYVYSSLEPSAMHSTSLTQLLLTSQIDRSRRPASVTYITLRVSYYQPRHACMDGNQLDHHQRHVQTYIMPRRLASKGHADFPLVTRHKRLADTASGVALGM